MQLQRPNDEGSDLISSEQTSGKLLEKTKHAFQTTKTRFALLNYADTFNISSNL